MRDKSHPATGENQPQLDLTGDRLALPLGDSYLLDPKHQQYAVFVYDLDEILSSDTGLLYPKKEKRFNRVYPNLIGDLGSPGDALFIARRLNDSKEASQNATTVFIHKQREVRAISIHSKPATATFIFGYCNWAGVPTFIKTLERHQTNWDGQQAIGLDQAHIEWFQQTIDLKTLVTARVLRAQRYNHIKAKQDRTAALRRADCLLKKHQQVERTKRLNSPAAKCRRELVNLRQRQKTIKRRLERERQQAEKAATTRHLATLNNLAVIATRFAQAAIQAKYREFSKAAVKDGYQGNLERDLGLPPNPPE